jgi:molecular chaperone GrpE (heat shock protein)
MLILLKQFTNSTANDKMKGKIVDVLEKGYKLEQNYSFSK